MTFKELKNRIKEEQKLIAQDIRLGKPLRKPSNYNQADEDAIYAYKDLDWNREQYRHRHIAYCQMFNNTPYALIEQPRDGNKPSSHELNRIKETWQDELDDEETIRNCA